MYKRRRGREKRIERTRGNMEESEAQGRGSSPFRRGGGSQCRIISGLHTFRVSVHYVRSGVHQRRARSKKGTPGRKKKGDDERGRKGTRGERISVRNRNILLLYRTRQLSRRNTRGPLPIKLSSR